MFLKQNLFNLCDVFEYIFNNKQEAEAAWKLTTIKKNLWIKFLNWF